MKLLPNNFMEIDALTTPQAISIPSIRTVYINLPQSPALTLHHYIAANENNIPSNSPINPPPKPIIIEVSEKEAKTISRYLKQTSPYIFRLEQNSTFPDNPVMTVKLPGKTL